MWHSTDIYSNHSKNNLVLKALAESDIPPRQENTVVPCLITTQELRRGEKLLPAAKNHPRFPTGSGLNSATKALVIFHRRMAFVPLNRRTLRLCLPPRPTCLSPKLTSRSYLGRNTEKPTGSLMDFTVQAHTHTHTGLQMGTLTK